MQVVRLFNVVDNKLLNRLNNQLMQTSQDSLTSYAIVYNRCLKVLLYKDYIYVQ